MVVTLSFPSGQQQYYGGRTLQNFDDAFELVKKAYDDLFKMHRAGLSLVLQGLPIDLGAHHDLFVM